MPSQGLLGGAGEAVQVVKPPAEEGSARTTEEAATADGATEEGAPVASLPGAEDVEGLYAEVVARLQGLPTHSGDANPQGDTQLTWVLLEHADSQMDDLRTPSSGWTLTAESQGPREIQIHQHQAVRGVPGWSLILVKRRDRDWMKARPLHIPWRLSGARG